ncbi:MAG: two-component sensor histidine kinase [Desulfobacter sp.]|nr:MAG: two-component sensor histidine kinase [Desulfobacter sp.]
MSFSKGDHEFSIQVKWVILARAVFSIVLIFSTLVFSSNSGDKFAEQPFFSLYKMAGGVLVLTFIYYLWLRSRKYLRTLAYVQTIADTGLVTAIVFVTGCFHSIFTFLYLVVIIYTAMLLLQRGGFVVAILSGIQYGLLIELEYFRIISPFPEAPALAASVDEYQILYRIIITIAACFAVAALSGILSFQLKTARQDLKITQEHLKRVEKMAAVDEMISGIAHEIKNPLASLSGSIQLLRDEAEPGSDKDRLMQIILRETERLEQIVTDIRLISKPGMGNSRETNMARAIEDVKTLFMNTPGWKSRIELVTRLEKELIVRMDPVHLQQIIWNLVKNAAESIEGKGTIFLTLNAPRNKRIYLTVRDTGKGIDPGNAPHIFDPFFTTKNEGTGLGLSIIHRIIDAYDGVMDFESLPGKGTVFTLIFQNAQSQKR